MQLLKSDYFRNLKKDQFILRLNSLIAISQIKNARASVLNDVPDYSVLMIFRQPK